MSLWKYDELKDAGRLVREEIKQIPQPMKWCTFLEEWNKEIRIMLEEDAFSDGKNVRYFEGR